ncbi:hypothetical protein D3C86_2250110 [compost metagenome]
MLAQRGVCRQRAVGIQNRIRGAVAIQRAQPNVFYQQRQALIQRRLFLFSAPDIRKRGERVEIE